MAVVPGSNESHSEGKKDQIVLRLSGAPRGTPFVIKRGGRVVGHGTVGKDGLVQIELGDPTPRRRTTYGLFVDDQKVARFSVR